MGFLARYPIPSDALFDLEVVLGEAVSNAVEHSGGRMLRVSVSVGRGVAVLTIEDNGHGFDPAAVPEPDMARERGRGLYIMRYLMDTTVRSGDWGTIVRAHRTWSDNGDSPDTESVDGGGQTTEADPPLDSGRVQRDGA